MSDDSHFTDRQKCDMIFNERMFWLLIRRALLIICQAIDRRYGKMNRTDKPHQSGPACL